MNLFHVIEDAYAIVRKPKGVYAQSKLYHRGDMIFLAYGSGFVRIGQKFGESWGTSHPDIKVIDFEGEGIVNRADPRFLPASANVRAIK